MVSAARAQYLKPTRGFQSNCFAFSVNSLEVMGRLPRLKSVLFILTSVADTTTVEGERRRKKEEEARST